MFTGYVGQFYLIFIGVYYWQCFRFIIIGQFMFISIVYMFVKLFNMKIILIINFISYMLELFMNYFKLKIVIYFFGYVLFGIFLFKIFVYFRFCYLFILRFDFFIFILSEFFRFLQFLIYLIWFCYFISCIYCNRNEQVVYIIQRIYIII